MALKKCSYCEVHYPANTEFFGKRKQSKDGLGYMCKHCRSKRWKAEKEGKKFISPLTRKKEREKATGLRVCKSCNLELPFNMFYYKKSHNGVEYPTYYCKECRRVYQRNKRKENKATNIEYHTIRENLNGARKRAKEDNYPFNIEIEDLMPFPTHCEVTGEKLIYGGNKHWNKATLDKVIPSKGYVKGNVKIISMRANFIKSDATLKELNDIISYIKRNSIGG